MGIRILKLKSHALAEVLVTILQPLDVQHKQVLPEDTRVKSSRFDLITAEWIVELESTKWKEENDGAALFLQIESCTTDDDAEFYAITVRDSK